MPGPVLPPLRDGVVVPGAVEPGLSSFWLIEGTPDAAQPGCGFVVWVCVDIPLLPDEPGVVPGEPGFVAVGDEPGAVADPAVPGLAVDVLGVVVPERPGPGVAVVPL